MQGQRGVFGRGVRLVARYVRAQPVTYSVSMVGATIYAGAAVGTTVVLGRATNEVVVPAFTTGTTAEQVRGEFRDSTWKAFWLTAVEGKPPAEAAAAAGISTGAVYIARSRVMARLRAVIEQVEGSSILEVG